MNQSQNPIQSLARAFNILEILADYPRGLTLTELARLVELSKSTVHRFLVSLGDSGYVYKESSSGKYRLTLRMFEVGGKAVHSLNILEIARPLLDHLAEVTGETIHLVLHDGVNVVYIYKYNIVAAAINIGSETETCFPIYCTGVGKAILAHLPPEEIADIWKNSNIVRYTENTITDYDDMLAELARIRRYNYAQDNEEHERYISCIAAPVFDYSGRPRYALSITAPTVRISETRRQEFIRLVQKVSMEISSLLGFHSQNKAADENFSYLWH